jgi:nuclear-control-of-ATPase protein 2
VSYPTYLACRYTLAAGLGVYAGVFLYRNSKLSGSPNLDNWVKSGVEALEGAWSNHVVSPLVMVRDELFKTFRE